MANDVANWVTLYAASHSAILSKSAAFQVEVGPLPLRRVLGEADDFQIVDSAERGIGLYGKRAKLYEPSGPNSKISKEFFSVVWQ